MHSLIFRNWFKLFQVGLILLFWCGLSTISGILLFSDWLFLGFFLSVYSALHFFRRYGKHGLQHVFKALVFWRCVRLWLCALHAFSPCSCLYLIHLALAASEADLLRSSGVMLAARFVPPIFPPLLPIMAMRREISDFLSLGVSVRERFGIQIGCQKTRADASGMFKIRFWR